MCAPGVLSSAHDEKLSDTTRNISPLKTYFEAYNQTTSNLYAPAQPRNRRCRSLRGGTETRGFACPRITPVVRLSLGKLLVNLLQVIKRTNSLTNGVVDRPRVLWVVGSSPTSAIINFFRFSPSMSNLKNTLPGYPQEMKRLG